MTESTKTQSVTVVMPFRMHPDEGPNHLHWKTNIRRKLIASCGEGDLVAVPVGKGLTITLLNDGTKRRQRTYQFTYEYRLMKKEDAPSTGLYSPNTVQRGSSTRKFRRSKGASRRRR